MKKILMFGTMLSVASAALAFGGVFGGGGHKSTTYKGGVDAIGVHFGGEKKTSDSQPEEEEETCPPEKQCGDYCCQGDNVCNTGSGEPQCCGYLDYIYHCCNSGSNPWCHQHFSYGCGVTDCCEGIVYKNVGMDNSDLCCTENTTLSCAQHDNDNTCLIGNCCAGNATSTCTEYNTTGKCILSQCCNTVENEQRCCDAGFAFVTYKEGDYVETGCCTQTVIRLDGSEEDGWYSQACCPEGSTTIDMNGNCCGQEGTFLLEREGESYCCPTGATTVDSDGNCCGHNGTILVGALESDYVYCCPAGSTGWSSDGCCPAGTFVDGDPWGDTFCTPIN